MDEPKVLYIGQDKNEVTALNLVGLSITQAPTATEGLEKLVWEWDLFIIAETLEPGDRLKPILDKKYTGYPGILHDSRLKPAVYLLDRIRDSTSLHRKTKVFCIIDRLEGAEDFRVRAKQRGVFDFYQHRHPEIPIQLGDEYFKMAGDAIKYLSENHD